MGANMRLALAGALAVAAGLTLGTREARAYDMDCAILLCMAGGFPSSAVCSAAHAEMIRRITPWPSQPPFGVCTYAAVPVALGGTGGSENLDISTPEYRWVRRTRVIWWRGKRWHSDEYGDQWSWSIRTCNHEGRGCRLLDWVWASNEPWPLTVMTENGQVVTTPGSGQAVMIEYGDHEGTLGYTRWQRY